MGGVAAAVEPRPGPARLLAWTALVGIVAALNFVALFADERPPKDAFYRWSNAIGGGVQYLILLLLALAIAIGLAKREAFALRRPTSWRTAATIGGVVIGGMWALGAIVSVFGNPEKEQGLVPEHWNSHRAAAFGANMVVVAVVAPVVEELIFRGLGFSLLERFGRWPAVLAVGAAFGLWHGLLVALPLLVAFGIGLAYMRARTGSVYPGMVLHGLFNTISVVFALLL